MNENNYQSKPLRILPKIATPQDLRQLTEQELLELCSELRQVIIERVSVNGGHLASNLGVVELTVALLLEYDFPNDRIVFDVGHQCYAWKLLTGRQQEFASLRQTGGLSGFPKTSESEFDSFNTGHSSTSVSAALGIARARSLTRREQRVVALIGDGAMTGGMSFEALNDLGQSQEPLLVILNDNQMSIDPNVGGMAYHLSTMRVSPHYLQFKTRWFRRLNALPVLGKGSLKVLRKLKKSLRGLRKQGVVFEHLGLKYYGPIDGNNLTEVRRYLRALRTLSKPVILHCLTRKGQGYSFAENMPAKYHGVAPFRIEAGLESNLQKSPTYSSTVGEQLCALAEQDERITVLTAAMKQGTGTAEFAQRFSQRFFDVGIAEQHMVTLAAGMACNGLRPYVTIYSTFAQRAMDQIIHDVCLQKLPVTFLIDRAGAVPADGETHQGYYDLAFFSSLPAIDVFSPVTSEDMWQALQYSLSAKQAVAIRYPRDKVAQLPNPDAVKGDTLTGFRVYGESKQPEQKCLVVLAMGTLLASTLKSLEQLSAKEREQVLVLGSCQSKLDETWLNELCELLTGYQQLITLEDGVKQGGIGEQIAYSLRDSEIEIEAIGITDLLADQASREELLLRAGLVGEALVQKVREKLKTKA